MKTLNDRNYYLNFIVEDIGSSDKVEILREPNR
jgi:hypothetical protein